MFLKFIIIIVNLSAMKCEQAWVCFALFIYRLFNHAVISLDYVAWNDRMVNER
jgi:hypothetical protein